MLYVGQKVVCVKRVWLQDETDIVYPQYGEIYTVAGICTSSKLPTGEYGIWLLELNNPVKEYKDAIGQRAFGAWGFLPLVFNEKLESENIKERVNG